MLRFFTAAAAEPPPGSIPLSITPLSPDDTMVCRLLSLLFLLELTLLYPVIPDELEFLLDNN